MLLFPLIAAPMSADFPCFNKQKVKERKQNIHQGKEEKMGLRWLKIRKDTSSTSLMSSPSPKICSIFLTLSPFSWAASISLIITVQVTSNEVNATDGKRNLMSRCVRTVAKISEQLSQFI